MPSIFLVNIIGISPVQLKDKIRPYYRANKVHVYVMNMIPPPPPHPKLIYKPVSLFWSNTPETYLS